MTSEERGSTLELREARQPKMKNGIRRKTHERRMSRNRDDKTCASSGGGPGRNKGEQSGLRSTFGTVDRVVSGRIVLRNQLDAPMKPSFGRARSGGAISNVTPHTTEVLPSRTRADEGAVETDPAGGRKVSSVSRASPSSWGAELRCLKLVFLLYKLQAPFGARPSLTPLRRLKEPPGSGGTSL